MRRLELPAIPAHLIPTDLGPIARHIDRRGPNRRRALRERLGTVAQTLSGEPVQGGLETVELLRGVVAAISPTESQHLWLALAVLRGRLPEESEVLSAVRRARLDGVLAALAPALVVPEVPLSVDGLRACKASASRWPRVRVVTDTTLVDMHHTAGTALATGIQRVARQTVCRWARDHELVTVGWSVGYRALRELSPAERTQALEGRVSPSVDVRTHTEVLVPWRCRYLLPELATEPRRLRAMQGILRHSGSRSGVIGFDTVPLTSAETTADGMGAGFAMMLAAIAHADRVATISNAAALEYQGWRGMLAGAGLAGPAIEAIPLATEGPAVTDDGMRRASALLAEVAPLAIVLCVGSHEPRKNHLAVLAAAQRLWDEGVEFALVFVGGNAWRSEQFLAQVAICQEDDRPVLLLHALDDEVLAATYRLATAVVFPSLNEGFGLPVAESLAAGTPVLTSNFGSMAEIAADGGALLVDPRDDAALSDGLRQLLIDEPTRQRLSEQARSYKIRTWDEYAAECWEYFMNTPLEPEITGQV